MITTVNYYIMQPTQNQITRFELRHQDCSGPYPDGSYVSLVSGKRYTSAYIARNYSNKPVQYNAIYLGWLFQS